MITEKYIPYDLAYGIKDIYLPIKYNNKYFNEGKELLSSNHWITKKESGIPAYTISSMIDWIREVHHYHISIQYYIDGDKKYYKAILINTEEKAKPINVFKIIKNKYIDRFRSNEAACVNAIEHFMNELYNK